LVGNCITPEHTTKGNAEVTNGTPAAKEKKAGSQREWDFDPLTRKNGGGKAGTGFFENCTRATDLKDERVGKGSGSQQIREKKNPG